MRTPLSSGLAAASLGLLLLGLAARTWQIVLLALPPIIVLAFGSIAPPGRAPRGGGAAGRGGGAPRRGWGGGPPSGASGGTPRGRRAGGPRGRPPRAWRISPRRNGGAGDRERSPWSSPPAANRSSARRR